VSKFIDSAAAALCC